MQSGQHRGILGLINNEEGRKAFFCFENTDMLGDLFELEISAENFEQETFGRNVLG